MNALCSRGTHLMGYRHNCLVVYRRRFVDLWSKTFWVGCIYCDQWHGPHREKSEAWRVADVFNHHDSLPEPQSTPARAEKEPE